MFFICILWGYDGLAGGVVISIADFRRDFGYAYGGDYVIDANWQLCFTAATLFGRLLRAPRTPSSHSSTDSVEVWPVADVL